MTLYDLERCNSFYLAFFSPNSTDSQADYITVVEDRPIISVKYCLPIPVFHFSPKLTHHAARYLCDSWASWLSSMWFLHRLQLLHMRLLQLLYSLSSFLSLRTPQRLLLSPCPCPCPCESKPCPCPCPVASPGFVARRGKDWNYVIWSTHGGLRGRVQQLLDD